MTRCRITIDARSHEAEIQSTEDGAILVTVDGERFLVTAIRPRADGKRAVAVEIAGRTHRVERLDLEHLVVDGTETDFRIEHVERRGAGAGVGASGLAVKPPMPGRIVRVAVATGDTVGAGDLLAVLEAMKMQNEVTSPAAGVVRRILVKEGDTVDGREAILELGPEEEAGGAGRETKEVTA